MKAEMREETVELDGHPFHLRHWGDPVAPVLLMLHGFPEYGGGWGDLAPHLAQRFHCVAPDQRGYGRSWAPPDVGDYATSKLVGDMAALIGAMGGGPVTVLGHDWGAAVAYGLAMFRPELVERLIVANGVHPVPFQRAMAAGGAQSAASQYINLLRREGAEKDLAANDFERLVEMFLARYRDGWLTDDKLAAYKAEWARGGRLRTMLNWYRASPLRIARPGEPLTDLPDLPLDRLRVRCPHLLIWGEGDTALLPESTEGLEDFAPDLTRVTVKGADHWLHHQKPAEVAAAILDWLPEGKETP
ncbi:alpha/beta fold hydrolase [Jhaorihella thermophila]|uniref:Pimeloyl-ACP methyl ester carboxylesterase n=1 Tax=Jhaorihella thermophila TaxID=488547 RepID=A0A1H5RLS9_9RHOB|nr:alpha/beta hydrolase [Jhaorihella thermophila]SEF39220.1 Pimeloyl-ACP methyl ester carboxylesterase [Jhaorihella thermophila]